MDQGLGPGAAGRARFSSRSSPPVSIGPTCFRRAGFYDPPPGASPYLGMECSGRIIELGPGTEASGWSIGDEVCALLSGGAYAERVAVPVGQLLPVPAGVSLESAAALPEVAATVWSMLTRTARMRAGQTLLVHGGGSGIGTFAIQYARALGVRVFTTARAMKHERLAALGADVTIDYTTRGFRRRCPERHGWCRCGSYSGYSGCVLLGP